MGVYTSTTENTSATTALTPPTYTTASTPSKASGMYSSRMVFMTSTVSRLRGSPRNAAVSMSRSRDSLIAKSGRTVMPGWAAMEAWSLPRASCTSGESISPSITISVGLTAPNPKKNSSSITKKASLVSAPSGNTSTPLSPVLMPGHWK